jgi:lipopolysaccharide transport system ATP-binding protein
MISLKNVNLYYPIMELKSHSLQIEIYNKIGGIITRKNKSRSTEFVHALNDINLQINSGTRLGIMGHNGAGKTSLLRVISGVYPPNSGDVKIIGKVSAMTDFTLGMDPNVSGLENIIFRLIFMGYSYKEAKKAVPEIIDFSELGNFINLPVRTYSTGMFIRLAFAISTHFTPDILILDEVIGAGDESFREKAIKRLDSLLYGARIVVLSSHDLGAIEKYCTSAIVMSHGKIVYEGNSKEAISFYKSIS